jgi:hypothetical protein
MDGYLPELQINRQKPIVGAVALKERHGVSLMTPQATQT